MSFWMVLSVDDDDDNDKVGEQMNVAIAINSEYTLGTMVSQQRS